MQVKSRSVRSWLINDVCFARGLTRSMVKGEIKRVMHEGGILFVCGASS